MEKTETKVQEIAPAGTNPQGGAKTEEKTFTQAELNAIVQKRVGEMAAKYGNYEELKAKAQKLDAMEEESKTELQKATDKAKDLEKELADLKKANALREIRDTVSKETGVPANLLTGATKEECEAQANAIKSFADPKAYPAVKDGGETKTTGTGGSTRDQFAEFAGKLLGGE